MQNVSSTFHNAVLAGAPQSAYLRFNNDVFTNEDIDISGGGMRWTQAFCNETDLKIGATMSAELSCSLLNEGSVLKNYSFGEFEAWLGVRIYDLEMASFGGFTSENNKAITLGEDPNWIEVDDVSLNVQPDFEPASVVIDRTVLYAISEDGMVWGYDLVNNSVMTLNLTPHMAAKALKFAKRHIVLCCSQGENTAYTSHWSKAEQRGQIYEYCRLGIFIADRPAKLMDATVDLRGYDRMTLFEKKLGKDLNLSSGTTFGGILSAICTDIGVTLQTTTFPNDSLTYGTPSEKFKSATYREIIGYIAEAAGRIARITRDGNLEFVWLNSTNTTVTADKYSEATIYSYQVHAIDKTAIYKDVGGVTESE